MIVQKLLSYNGIVYDKKELAFQIQSHPSYPSLHAITGVLDHFNIENIAAEIPTDTQTLQQLPDSFIAQISTDKGNDLVTVKKDNKKSGYSVISGEDNKEKKLTEGEFLTQFTGIIVAVEKTDDITTTKEESGVKNIVLLGLVAASILFLLINKDNSVVNYAYSILAVFGIITSYSILKQELGESTAIGNAFCSGTDEKKDCDAVLNSKGAEIIKNHKLSDLSIVYFSSVLLASFLLGNLNTLYLISLASLPITIYSIYYQYKVVKSWCLLCLTIVGVLWVQAALIFVNGDPSSIISNTSLADIAITIVSFLGVYLAWNFIKPMAKELSTLQKEKIDFVKFKRNFNLFNSLLVKSPSLNTNINNPNEIIFGNKNASLEIVTVTNPFCGHCKGVHEIVDEILKKYNDSAKIIIRFNVPVDDTESAGVKVTSTLLELYNSGKLEDCKIALDEIYGGTDHEKWLEKWNKGTQTTNPAEVLKAEKDWCVENGINFTPEILINGKSFPKEYNRTDLIFFIEDLEEHFQATSNLQVENQN
ncbi:vitamin K epoxide reductase family protein [uncultured Tenacibaculum sp.]|uniref:vitamin K epoxide reductase family protein n=1 Tax=uncultured Tenacibaculum sp. TaxID=174713 RepID=UPI002608C76C|nr:vitamin K epoxide reductase family protein [uncultured Tenacibaculum sp.]